MMQAVYSPEAKVLKGATQRHIAEDALFSGSMFLKKELVTNLFREHTGIHVKYDAKSRA
jgi:hypothetical protein